MKKFLLSTAVLFSAFAMNAEIKTVTYDFKANDYGLTRQTDNAGAYIDNGTKLTVNDGTEITLTKIEDKNGWRLWSDGLRAYKNSDAGMTISTSEGAIKKIEFSAKNNVISEISGIAVSGTTYGVACDGNNIPLSFKVDNNGAIYTLTLTVDTEGTGTSTTVSAIGGGDTPVDPEPPVVSDGFYSGLSSNADDWTLDEGTVPEGLTYVWNWDSKYNQLKATAFVKQVAYESDVWAISPVIDLTGAKTAELKFAQTANYLNDNFDQIVTAVRVENGEWQTIEVAPQPAGNSWNFVDSSAMLNDFIGKKIQIGFNYKSTTENACTWEVKDLTVTGDTASVVDEIESNEGVAAYYTLQGVKVANPENGLYIVVKNGKASKVLVK